MILLVPVVLLAFLLWWEKHDRANERREWGAERMKLLLRIQAPEQAIIEQLPERERVPAFPDYSPFGGTEDEL